jgi:hypothetical protein
MKQSLIRGSLILSIALVASVHPASGANFFTEDFSDNSPRPNMILGNGSTDKVQGFTGSPTTDFQGAFKITSGEGKRIYLATKGNDYADLNFRFDATVSMPNTTNAWAYAFIGMGDHNATGGYGEPGMPSIAAAIDPAAESVFRGRDNGQGVSDTPIANPRLGKHRVRMTWNAITKLALFELDLGYTGEFSADHKMIIDGSDNGFTSSNSRLFVGGGDGVTFDDISVTAVPGSDTDVLWIIGAVIQP